VGSISITTPKEVTKNAHVNWTFAYRHAKKSEEKYWCRDGLEEELEMCVINSYRICCVEDFNTHNNAAEDGTAAVIQKQVTNMSGLSGTELLLY
jgi:hypothetical protein